VNEKVGMVVEPAPVIELVEMTGNEMHFELPPFDRLRDRRRRGIIC
jgi:hypothetical protein